MREILFRGKKIDNGECVYGYLYEDIAAHRHISYIIKGGFIPAVSMPSERFIEVDTKTVGQYVGLKDSEGKDIYEGDIVKRKNDRYYYSVHYGTTEFGISQHREDGVFANDFKFTYDNTEQGIVCGNIHENPELLGDQK